MELQNVQASALVRALANRDIQWVEALQDKYEDEIQTQRFTNLLRLLIPDPPLNSSFAVKNVGGRPAETLAADSNGVTSETNEVQTADGSDKQDVCCATVMEDLPYLEVLCFPDTRPSVKDIIPAEDRGTKGDESSATKTPQSCKKQGSLITFAWSKPGGDGTVYEADADGETEQEQDDQSSLKTHIQPVQCEETVQQRHVEELTYALSPDGSSAEQHCSKAQQRPVEDKPEDRGPASEHDQQTLAPLAENLHPVQPHLSRDSSTHTDDCCSETSSRTMEVQREMTEVEMCPTEVEPKLWDLRGPEQSTCDGLTKTQDYAVDCSVLESEAMRERSLIENERASEGVSALERERTMRNLVDMQRKVEKKQQRDRERQLLRVQERLAIVQNRKTEEDLLGLKHIGRLKHLTQDLPLENKSQQKTAVRERLEQIRRERSYVMQSKRDRNTAGFKELLAPVALHSNDTEEVGVD
ncbi:uncharacterized protein LOC133444291 [Cololabis saira]|uniref:uncharacterized protein LOC133444291 n=1 Tax=Cololabis saira TaxID=129043 RepID=UPI002AD3FDB3|nr:uncharacterized protein LOC133444291 [Cololabis saira]